jgi:osmoprotectant transport system permease protein
MDVLNWFADGQNWQGDGGIPNRMNEHIRLSGLSIVVAAVLAIPLALVLGHRRGAADLSIPVVNIARAIPSFAIIAIAFPFSLRAGLGFGFWPTFIALVFLAVPPIFANAYTGVAGARRDIVEAGRGMGMRPSELMLNVELPVAAPLIMTGLRIAAVQVVATATLGALVGWGGLGRYIIDGFSVQDNVRVFAGALLVAILAIITDLAFGFLQRLVDPERRVAAAPAVAAAAKT